HEGHKGYKGHKGWQREALDRRVEATINPKEVNRRAQLPRRSTSPAPAPGRARRYGGDPGRPRDSSDRHHAHRRHLDVGRDVAGPALDRDRSRRPPLDSSGPRRRGEADYAAAARSAPADMVSRQ